MGVRGTFIYFGTLLNSGFLRLVFTIHSQDSIYKILHSYEGCVNKRGRQLKSEIPYRLGVLRVVDPGT